jgi:hypothetical protein
MLGNMTFLNRIFRTCTSTEVFWRSRELKRGKKDGGSGTIYMCRYREPLSLDQDVFILEGSPQNDSVDVRVRLSSCGISKRTTNIAVRSMIL